MSDVLTRPGASCRFYAEAPSWNGQPTGAIGALRCDDAQAGAALLAEACALLAARGAHAVLAPMDGDTWHSYRVVTESDGSPPFALEPQSGPHDLAALQVAGFEPVGRYVSTQLEASAPGPEAPPEPGIAIEPWDGQEPEAMLRAVFALSLRAFARNPFYRPIAEDAFLALYRPLVPRLDPEFVLLARDRQGTLRGFIFGYPDWLEGAAPRTVVMKSIASLRFGPGAMLLAVIRRRAAARGHSRVIHALMHEDSRSLALSVAEGGRVFRRYALMGRRLP